MQLFLHFSSIPVERLFFLKMFGTFFLIFFYIFSLTHFLLHIFYNTFSFTHFLFALKQKKWKVNLQKFDHDGLNIRRYLLQKVKPVLKKRQVLILFAYDTRNDIPEKKLNKINWKCLRLSKVIKVYYFCLRPI